MKLQPFKNIVSQVSIKGSMDGYILTIEDSLGFKDDIALTLGELSQFYQLLKKRFATQDKKTGRQSMETKVGVSEKKSKRSVLHVRRKSVGRTKGRK